MLNRKRFDGFSFSNYVIKKGCSHGARREKTEEQIYHHFINSLTAFGFKLKAQAVLLRFKRFRALDFHVCRS